jgi:hypothetical protein
MSYDRFGPPYPSSAKKKIKIRNFLEYELINNNNNNDSMTKSQSGNSSGFIILFINFSEYYI